jgi:CheY-like chemotaxis protein
MPIMNGWEFLQEFVPLYGDKLTNTKIVILSSTIDPQDFANAKKFPIVIQFISKPLSVESLEELKANDSMKMYFN